MFYLITKEDYHQTGLTKNQAKANVFLGNLKFIRKETTVFNVR